MEFVIVKLIQLNSVKFVAMGTVITFVGKLLSIMKY